MSMIVYNVLFFGVLFLIAKVVNNCTQFAIDDSAELFNEDNK